jgi:hypothetical protein
MKAGVKRKRHTSEYPIRINLSQVEAFRNAVQIDAAMQ